MNADPEADALYLDQIVELILLIRDDLVGTTEGEFLLDRTKGDATALRLGAIEELGPVEEACRNELSRLDG